MYASTSEFVDPDWLKTSFVHTPDGSRLALTEVRNPKAGSRDHPSLPRQLAFLLIHGFAQNRLAFTNGTLPSALLARGARVFIGELRGHGLSRTWATDLTSNWNLQTLLDFDLPTLVRGVCEAAQVDRVHYIGHSMGGILGYGLLSRAHRVASLTSLAAPVAIGDGKPMVRWAAKMTAPILKWVLPSQVRTDRLLRGISSFVSTEPRPGMLGAINGLYRLANPDTGNRQRILEILRNGEPSSKALLLDLVDIARGRSLKIGSIDLVRSVEQSQLAVAAVVAEEDIFAGPRSVRAISSGKGPRRILVLPRAAHVDLTMGDHCQYIVDTLWPFLTESA